MRNQTESSKPGDHDHAEQRPALDPSRCRHLSRSRRRRGHHRQYRPVLPTPFRIGVAGAATLAATGLAAADLWKLRTGREQSISVDFRHATASLRSGTYMKLGDGEVSHARNSIMGVYPTKDGRWSYIHANFPNHRAAALGVLGVPEDRAAVAKAC